MYANGLDWDLALCWYSIPTRSQWGHQQYFIKSTHLLLKQNRLFIVHQLKCKLLSFPFLLALTDLSSLILLFFFFFEYKLLPTGHIKRLLCSFLPHTGMIYLPINPSPQQQHSGGLSDRFDFKPRSATSWTTWENY